MISEGFEVLRECLEGELFYSFLCFLFWQCAVSLFVYNMDFSGKPTIKQFSRFSRRQWCNKNRCRVCDLRYGVAGHTGRARRCPNFGRSRPADYRTAVRRFPIAGMERSYPGNRPSRSAEREPQFGRVAAVGVLSSPGSGSSGSAGNSSQRSNSGYRSGILPRSTSSSGGRGGETFGGRSASGSGSGSGSGPGSGPGKDLIYICYSFFS